jgi:hypothetical protein
MPFNQLFDPSLAGQSRCMVFLFPVQGGCIEDHSTVDHMPKKECSNDQALLYIAQISGRGHWCRRRVGNLLSRWITPLITNILTLPEKENGNWKQKQKLAAEQALSFSLPVKSPYAPVCPNLLKCAGINSFVLGCAESCRFEYK